MKLSKRYKIPKVRVVDRVGELITLCTDKRVLHLGCADTPFTQQRGPDLLHSRLAKVTHQLYGVDASSEGVEILRELGFSHVYVGNVEELDRLDLGQQFDIILAGEILEHLMNPGLFLDKVRALMSNETLLILTIPNAFCAKTFLLALARQEKVHEDHNCWFSYRTILQLLSKANFSCSSIYFYQGIANKGLGKLADSFFSFFPKLSPCLADGLIVQAVINSQLPKPSRYE